MMKFIFLTFTMVLLASCTESQTTLAGSSATIEGLSYNVSPRVGGIVEKIHVDEGDKVKVGQPLIEIQCDDLRSREQQASAGLESAKARLQQAEAQKETAIKGTDIASRQTRAARASVSASRSQISVLDEQIANAERTAARLKRLRANGGGTEKQLDDAKTQLEVARQKRAAASSNTKAAQAKQRVTAGGELAAASKVTLADAGIALAKAELERAEVMLKNATWIASGCVILAVHDGYVQMRAFEEGEFVTPGARMLTVVNTDTVETTFYLPNRFLEKASAGVEVNVVADAIPGKTFAGKITRVSEIAEFTPRNIQTADDRDRLVYAVTATISNPDHALRPGMPAEVRLSDAVTK